MVKSALVLDDLDGHIFLVNRIVGFHNLTKRASAKHFEHFVAVVPNLTNANNVVTVLIVVNPAVIVRLVLIGQLVLVCQACLGSRSITRRSSSGCFFCRVAFLEGSIVFLKKDYEVQPNSNMSIKKKATSLMFRYVLSSPVDSLSNGASLRCRYTVFASVVLVVYSATPFLVTIEFAKVAVECDDEASKDLVA